MKKITLSKELSFPLDLITQSVSILAKRRVGKSFTARKLAEGVFNAGQQICIIDPKGDWWGIRYASDGNSPGLPIFILGGEHGDLPIEVNSGSLVAKLLVEDHVSILLDLSMFRKYEVATFMAQFLEDLYRLKAQEKYRTALMLLVDEADAIAPQKPQENEARMLGAIEDIVRRGGQRGIGCTMISQRSAVLNKNVLTQTQILIALRTIAPQDIQAMDEWIKVHGEVEERKILMQSLPSLPVGDCWVWSPGWPTDEGIFKRIHVDPITTFDSGATPKPGETRKAVKNIAQVNIDALRKQMSEVLDKAKENDPKLLKQKIKELQAEISKKVKPEQITQEFEQLRINNRDLQNKLKRAQEIIAKDAKQMSGIAANIKKAVDILNKENENILANFHQAGNDLNEIEFKPVNLKLVSKTPGILTTVLEKDKSIMTAQTSNGPVRTIPNNGAIRMLKAAAMFEKITRNRMALIASISPRSGSFRTYISQLKTQGLLSGSGDLFWVTKEGKEYAGPVDRMPTESDELISVWCKTLGASSGAGRIFKMLAEGHPSSFSKEEIGDAVQISPTSGSFRTYMSKLKSNGLIVKDGENYQAVTELFS